MNRRLKIGISLALLLVAAVVISIALVVRPRFLSSNSSPASLPAGTWLVAGPFAGNGDNALYKDYLSGDGESQARPREGEIAGWRLKGLVRWQTASPSATGLIDLAAVWPAASFQSIAYVYTEIESDRDQYAVATIGSGQDTQLRLNGEIVYESRVFRTAELDRDTVVLQLRKGINSVLVKTQRFLGWSFQWTVTVPPGPLFVNKLETIVPDFRVAQPAGAWGQVEVTNASGSRLSDVVVEVLADELLSPSRSELASLDAEEVRRIPLWIASKKTVSAGSNPKVRIRVSSGRDEQLLEIAPRLRGQNTSFVTTYRSTLDGSVQPYSVLLPPSFDSKASYALILLLHGSHVTPWGRNIISYSPKKWAIQIAVHDRGNNDYRDVGEVDINEVLAEVGKRYRIDPDRMYLSGHSMGGYGTWFLATRYPDRWAAISPQTAETDLSREGETGGGDRPPGFQARLRESRSPIKFAENLLHVPAYMMHGALDSRLPVAHSRNMSARLLELGYRHVYDENPDGEHWWGTKPEHQGTLCVDKPEISEFLQEHEKRAINPKIVFYKTDSLRYRRAYWVTIDELDTANQMASIRAEVTAPDYIAVRADNVSQFTLELNDQLIAFDHPVDLSVNGKRINGSSSQIASRITVRREADGRYLRVDNDAGRFGSSVRHEARNQSSGDLSLTGGRGENVVYSGEPLAQAGQAARSKAGRKTKAEATTRSIAEPTVGNPNTSSQPEPLIKSESLYGPVNDAFNKPFIFVVGSTGSGEEAERMHQANRRAVQAFARDWMTRCNGIATIKTDAQVTPDDIASSNLILFGNAATNSLISAINDQLPIRFGPTGLIRGDRERGDRAITSGDSGMVMIRPNPLNKRRYVVIVGGTTANSMLLASRLKLTDLPDYVIFDRSTLSGRRVDFLSGGFFDKHWQLSN